MTIEEKSIEAYWTRGNLGDTITERLMQMGLDLHALRPEDLAPVDQFHIRGHAATRELAELCALGSGTRVLDVGCGLGGSARYLATRFGCHVTGLDVTEEYCRVAALFSRRLGMDRHVDFRHGSALALPFADASYDAVWTEHAQMNIADKPRLYAEMVRVLKPGGRLLFHDVFQGPGGEVAFPVPWADEPSLSALIAPDDLQRLLAGLGLRAIHWEDVSVPGLAWIEERVEAFRSRGFPPLGTNVLMGRNTLAKFESQVRNLRERRIVLVQAALDKPM
ncbi:MAG: class I SAM-dependent methyltransferase [Candidatus Lambdaproteobacteria bacterium]|nr:class I SAM-dependent methyltransferase [Candidatus Lambdaproteobacteria bacterium]